MYTLNAYLFSIIKNGHKIIVNMSFEIVIEVINYAFNTFFFFKFIYINNCIVFLPFLCTFY